MNRKSYFDRPIHSSTYSLNLLLKLLPLPSVIVINESSRFQSLQGGNMKKFLILVLTLAILAGPQAAFAASPWAQGSYADQIKGKFSFGFKNTFLGWTKIFSTPGEYQKDGKCALLGVGEGIMNAVLITGGGALHLITFPLPQIDIPLPGNGISV